MNRREAFRLWLKLGLISFGGPAGQIALLHHELVERRGWVTDLEFSRALNVCMLLPGPEALQMVIYLGWRLHGTAGGLVAGLCFFLPACVAMLGLAFAYVTLGDLSWAAGALVGLKAAVLALIVHAVIRLARGALQVAASRLLAAGAGLAMVLEAASFPLILAAAAAAGVVLLTGDRAAATRLPPTGFPWGRACTVALAGVLLWCLPWGVLIPLFGHDSLPGEAYALFTQAALVSFGGAYAVIAWVQHQVVEVLGWASLDDVMMALALAEATPGPLVTALQFLGFVAGWNAPVAGGPLLTATGVALLAAYATFLPSFVFILAGAAGIDGLAGRPRLQGALAGITAAAVGAIASLGWQFGTTLLVSSPSALLIAVPAGLLLIRGKVGSTTLILGGLVVGLLLHAAGLA